MTTATAVDSAMRACPDLASLELTPLAVEIRAHVDGCTFCQLVVEVCAQARRADDDCLHYDALLAARSDGTLNSAGKNLLQRHLASCEACREVADTLAPVPGEPDAVSLPSIGGDAYTLGGEVGRGGMGRVIDAEDNRIGRSVVIKELLGSSRSHAARFEREARLNARLQHPGILPIYEVGKWESDGTPFYSMRKIEGRTLEDALKTAKTLPKRLELLPSLIAACETVAFAHSKRVIHRDLKPQNIMVGTYGETIVIDWGLAKDLEADDDGDPDDNGERAGASDRLTGIGQAMGTAPYMPLEQACGQPVDERSDVYALGAILYQLLGGSPPYRGENQRELIARVRAGPPRPIEEVERRSPPALISIVNRAMGRQAEQRYPTARELATELVRFQKGLLVETHTYSRAELVGRFLRRHRGAVTVTAAAALMLAIVATVSVRNVLRSRSEARATARELLLEKGRIEQLAGNHLRALAYLHEAAQQGEHGPALELLLGQAVADIATGDKLDCDGDDRTLELSRDGTLLAVACHDRVRMWRVDTQPATVVATLEVEESHAGFDNLMFSRDDTLIATWGEEGIARLWRVDPKAHDAKPAVFRSFPHHQPGQKPVKINFTTFSKDATRIATTGNDGFAQIWNVESGREERSFDGMVGGARFDASQVVRRLYGRLTVDDKLVTLTFSGAGAKYDLAGNIEGTFEHGGTVGGGEESPDAAFAATCGTDGVSKVIDLASGQVVELAGHRDLVWRCTFDASARRVMTASHDGTAKIWTIERDAGGKLHAHMVTTVSHGDLIWIGRFSPDGTLLVTISPGKNMKVWDSVSGALLATYNSRGKDAQFLRDNRLAALRGDGRIQIWPRVSSRLAAFSARGNAELIGATPDGQCVATLDTSVALWAATGEPIAHPPIAPPLAYADGRIAGAFVTPDASDPAKSRSGLVVIDTHTGKAISRLTDDALLAPSTLQLSVTGDRIAATWPTRAEIWDFARNVRLLAIPNVNRLVISDDGKRAVTWTEFDPSAPGFKPPTLPVIWDVDARVPLATLPAIDARPIGFALDGRRLVVHELVDSLAAVASIWDLDRGLRLLMQRKVDIPPTLDAKGRWVATIGSDREVSVWDAVDGSQASTFTTEPYQSVQADENGKLLVAIGEYGRTAMILSAVDGSVLARHELDHERATIDPHRGFGAPTSTAWWTRDARAIGTLSRGFATWSAINQKTPAEIAEVVRHHVPYRIDNGRLEVIRNGRIVGTVTRRGEPLAGVPVEMLMRRPANMTDKQANWDSMRTQVTRYEATTDSSGSFAFENLVPEYEYEVTVAKWSSEALAEVDPTPIPITLD